MFTTRYISFFKSSIRYAIYYEKYKSDTKKLTGKGKAAITSITIYYSKIDNKGRGIWHISIQIMNTDILQQTQEGEEEE